MTKDIIDQAIAKLETTASTYDDIQELANLYIVRDHLLVGNSHSAPPILPSYSSYCAAKRDYQLQMIPAEIVLSELSNVCTELSDLLNLIYANSDIRKERKQIVSLVENLYKNFSKKG